MASGGSGPSGSNDEGGGGLVSPLTTKGDLWGFTTVNARVPVGSNGKVLTADSSAATGVSWQDVPSTSGGWTDDGTIVRLTTVTDKVIAGALDIMPGLEAPYDSMWRFTKNSPDKSLTFMVDNQSVTADAIAMVAVLNDMGVGVGAFSCSSAYSNAAIGVVAGDHGLFSLTALDVDPAGDAGMVFHSGVLPQKWITFSPGASEKMRLTTIGDLLIGSQTEFDSGSCLLFVSKDHVGNTYATVSNLNTAANSRAQYVARVAGPLYLEVGITPSTYGGDVGIEAAMAFLRGDGSGGVGILTAANAPIKLKTNGNNTRYEIDGDGSMAWFGGSPVAQQGPIADAAGGAVVDAEARTAINAALAAFRNYALLST